MKHKKPKSVKDNFITIVQSEITKESNKLKLLYKTQKQIEIEEDKIFDRKETNEELIASSEDLIRRFNEIVRLLENKD
jgi:hypothetical protein